MRPSDPCQRCGNRRGGVSKAGASPHCEACGALAGELTDGMPPRTGSMEVRPEDATLLHVMATLVEFLPAEKRAAHLGPKCAAMAERMEQAIGRAA